MDIKGVHLLRTATSAPPRPPAVYSHSNTLFWRGGGGIGSPALCAGPKYNAVKTDSTSKGYTRWRFRFHPPPPPHPPPVRPLSSATASAPRCVHCPPTHRGQVKGRALQSRGRAHTHTPAPLLLSSCTRWALSPVALRSGPQKWRSQNRREHGAGDDLTWIVPPGRASFEHRGEGGRGFWTQNLVYPKWPDQIFPIVNFVFSDDGPFGLGRGGGGLGEVWGRGPPPLWLVITLKKPCPRGIAPFNPV